MRDTALKKQHFAPLYFTYRTFEPYDQQEQQTLPHPILNL